MAGFDATFRYLPQDGEVIEACLAAAKRRARVFHVRFRIERPAEEVVYLKLGGQTYALDIFLERLRRDLPTIAEASPNASRSPAERRRVALGLVDVLNRYRGMLYDSHPEEWVPTVRAKRDPILALPHEIVPTKASTLLQARMFVTMDMLASWHYREVAPEVLLEEIHTAAELLLTACVNRRSKRLSFRQLVDLAHARNLLTASVNPDDTERVRLLRVATGWAEAMNDIGRDVLLSLKDCRKDVRHRGAAGAEEWLTRHFWDAASILEELARHAR